MVDYYNLIMTLVSNGLLGWDIWQLVSAKLFIATRVSRFLIYSTWTWSVVGCFAFQIQSLDTCVSSRNIRQKHLHNRQMGLWIFFAFRQMMFGVGLTDTLAKVQTRKPEHYQGQSISLSGFRRHPIKWGQNPCSRVQQALITQVFLKCKYK